MGALQPNCVWNQYFLLSEIMETINADYYMCVCVCVCVLVLATY